MFNETLFDDRNTESLFYQIPQYTAIYHVRYPSCKDAQGEI